MFDLLKTGLQNVVRVPWCDEEMLSSVDELMVILVDEGMKEH